MIPFIAQALPPTQPAPTPAPIEDIVPPVWVFPWPVWAVVLAVVVVLLLIALVVWLIVRSRKTRPLTPLQRALASCDSVRTRVETVDAYELCVEVSDALRRYLHEARGLQATTQTSLEFLESLRGDAQFSEEQQATLANFLEKADMVKFARMTASKDEIRVLIDTAEEFVRQADAQAALNEENAKGGRGKGKNELV